MKRNQQTKSNHASGKPRILESRRLADARGGIDLGITVAHRPLLPSDLVQMQHNEALVQL